MGKRRNETIENISKLEFGKPFDTNTVVLDGDIAGCNIADYGFSIQIKETLKLSYKLQREDVLFGLGENVGGLNKRGCLLESFCTDEPHHGPEKKSLYGAHNFLIIDGLHTFGLFIDFPGRVTFDLGFTKNDEMTIDIHGRDVTIYFIQGESLRAITKSFLRLVGRSYIPPKWAFGYQQSRWGYKDSMDVETIAENFIKHDIPCDAIYLDIDYMEHFKDFSIDKNRFPDFEGVVKNLLEKGFRLVPIIDAGVKIEGGYDVYEEGLEADYFCVDESGEPFEAAVWPGKVVFPDFLNPEAREWFGKKYKMLTDCGIEGFWNDMNEPAIFYTDRGLDVAFKSARESEGKNLDVFDFFALRDRFNSLNNSLIDYDAMHHNVNGKLISHTKLHNLYGRMMTEAAAEGLANIDEKKRFLLFSRASIIGMHRFSGIWTGDNSSCWEHLELFIKMMPNINMCGFLYSGSDVGGYGNSANSELLVRWTQMGIFAPLFRNHSAIGTRDQEPYSFDEETTVVIRNLIRLRYALIPYIYSEFMKAAKSYDVYFAPLYFEYEDRHSRRVEDQLLVGESLMFCPIFKENAVGRYVWLPENMLLWRSNAYERKTYEVLAAGHHYLAAETEELLLFLRRNKILVMAEPANTVEKLDCRILRCVAFVEDHAEYEMYDDDGISASFENCQETRLKISVSIILGEVEISVECQGVDKQYELDFEIVLTDGTVHKRQIKLNK